jgi:arylsulfatase A-like enzyme/Tfp pilus assembly protein PilF
MGKLRAGFVLLFVFCLCRPGLYPLDSTSSAASQKSRLNLLLITIDTIRADRVGFCGSSRLKTPYMDGLASKSLIFLRAFAHNPMTLPSHTNILLGVTPSYHGVHDNVNFIVRGEFLTLAEHLKTYGYSTGAFLGGFPLDSRFGLDQGFDVYDDYIAGGDLRLNQGANAGERKAQAVLDSALKWLQGRASPWFAWVHFYDPHDPYTPPEPFRSQHASNLYEGEVAYVDSVIGNLLRALEGNGLFQNTMIVLTGDHGESLGEHGEKMHGYLAYNTTLWIPLLIYYPSSPHRVVGQNVSHIDIFPTVCDGLQIKKPAALQGTSLFPLVKGKNIAEPVIYFESLSPYYSMGWAPIRGTIAGRDKFIDSPLPEFYDLLTDFDEKNNLAARQKLDGYQKELDRIMRAQTSEKSLTARQKADRETREKLRSLGYIANLPSTRKAIFTPQDAVAALLPYHNRAMEALDLFQAGKVQEAIGILRKVLDARKNISSAYLNLAIIYRSQNRLRDAIAILRSGLEALPENYAVYFQLIANLYDAGEFEDVLRTFKAGTYAEIEFDPVIWNYIGLAYEKMGDDPRAQASYDESLAIDDTFAVTYNNLGAFYFRVFRQTHKPESYARAVKNYQKAVDLDPDYGAAFHGLGVAYYQSGNYAQAIASLEKGRALDPSLDEAFYFLGSAYLKTGNKPKALSYFLKYKATPSYKLLSSSAKAKLEEIIAQAK